MLAPKLTPPAVVAVLPVTMLKLPLRVTLPALARLTAPPVVLMLPFSVVPVAVTFRLPVEVIAPRMMPVVSFSVTTLPLVTVAVPKSLAWLRVMLPPAAVVIVVVPGALMVPPV